MTQPSRETARDGLATLLTTQLITTDAIVQAVYNYRKGDLLGQSPVVCVSSAGSSRDSISFDGELENIAFLTVHVFVVYAADGWTEANAEDRLDLIERTIADVIRANGGETSYWLDLGFNGDSVRNDINLGGVEYIQEAIPIAAQLAYG